MEQPEPQDRPQVLYRKWRSRTFGEIVGQEHVTTTLLNALRSGRVAHAYLFCGPRGTGKTSTGRVLAKALNCLTNGQGEPCDTCELCRAITEGRSLDLIEIDAASNRGIDEIRELRDKVQYAPAQGRYKVYIIDEVHMLTRPAFNALLKTLEEPPPQTVFVLATTEAQDLPPTIISRCQRFDFRRLTRAPMVERLEHICRAEGIQVEDGVLPLLARASAGSLRDAENLLEQLFVSYGSPLRLDQAQELLGVTADRRVNEFALAMFRRDVATGLGLLNQVTEDGIDMRRFQRDVVAVLRAALLAKHQAADVAEVAGDEAAATARQVAGQASDQEIARVLKTMLQADLRSDPHSSLPLELALLESTQEPTSAPAQAASVPPSTERTVARNPEPARPPAPSQRPAPARPAAPPAAPVANAASVVMAATPVDPNDPLAQLRAAWPQVIDGCRAVNKTVGAFLSASLGPIEVSGDRVVIGVLHDYAQQRLEQATYRRVVDQAIGEQMGGTYRSEYTIMSQGQAPASGDVRESPLVKAAVVEWGARVVELEEGLL